MKKTDFSFIKDIIISILIVISLIMLFSIIFYNKTGLTKVIPEPEEYSMSEEMEKDISEAVVAEDEEVVTTYFIDATDLKKVEKTKEYDKGKKNPFAADSGGTIISTNTTNNDNMIVYDNTSVTNTFYEDDGTK